MTRLPALALLLLLAGFVPAQPPAARKKALLEGTHVLRRILFDHGFRSLQDMDELAREPRRTLLVALGDLDILASVPGGLEKFVSKGGAVLLASDRPFKDEAARKALLAVAGVTISEQRLSCLDPQACYEGLAYCPILVPVKNQAVDLFQNHQNPMGGILRVATNVPSSLRLRRFGAVGPIAVLPGLCVVELGREFQGVQMPPRERFPLFAVAGPAGAGRVLALADHSVFINEMMLPKTTNNVEFTYNCVRWLREGDPTRDLVLVMEEGKPQTRLDLPMKSAHVPIDELLRLLFDERNTWLAGAEDWLARREDEGSFSPRLADALEKKGLGWGTGALVAATLAGLLWFAWRVGFAERFKHDRLAEPLLLAIGDRLPDQPLARQRVEAMLAGDAREPLRELARSLFAGLAQPPRASGGAWLGRWRLSWRLRRAWRLASGWPSPIPPRRVAWWQRELDDLKASRDRGRWGRTDDHRAA